MARQYDHEVLEHFAYEAWLERGRPLGSPEIDWATAEARAAREREAAAAASVVTRTKKRQPPNRSTTTFRDNLRN